MLKPVKISFMFCATLIVLRLAIGWHFFVEGSSKLKSICAGDEESITAKPWSSAGFLRRSQGPLASFFREKADDPDLLALEWLQLKQADGDQLNGKEPAKAMLSDALVQRWDDYKNRFVEYFSTLSEDQINHGKLQPLSAEQKQKIDTKLEQAKEKAAAWLSGIESDDTPKYTVTREVNNTTVEIPISVPDQIQKYKYLLEEISEIQNKEHVSFRSSVSPRLASLTSEANELRNTMVDDLFGMMTERLESVLTPQQKAIRLAKTENLRVIEPTSMVKWTDTLISWGLTIIGACLLLGVFSRTAAFFGGLFLLSVYLVVPALPWINLPTPGTYRYVNETIIEMLALFVLASIPTGRWLGLDAFIHAINPFKKKDEPETQIV